MLDFDINMRFFIATALASFFQGGIAAGGAEWRSRTIYQVFTDRFARTDGSTTYPCNVNTNVYCGGTWKGLENKINYIKNMGFTAVWISPVTAQVDEAYHGYYQTDLYSVNSKFGTVDDLKLLASKLHSNGMYLMVDVVPNHMAYAGCPDHVDYGKLKVFSSPDHFHRYCPMNNMDNQTEVEDCWLGNCNMTMPDIRTEDNEVAKEMNTWIKSLVSNYSIDGLRIDSVKNVNKDFFPPWCEAAGVFCMGEVSEGKPNYTYPYQQYMDSVLDYPLYYAINRVFQQQTNMSDLVVNLAACTQSKDNEGCKDSTLLGTFFENHDNPRFPSVTKDLSLVKNALAFTILSDGIPIVYQGQEQHFDGGDDPGCREALWFSSYNTDSPLYKHTAYLNQIRNHIAANQPSYLTYQTRVLSYTSDVIQLRKGDIRTILTNQGEKGGSYTLTTQGMEFEKGETVLDVLSCTKYTATEKGEVDVKMHGGMPSALVKEGSLKGSGMCGLS